MYSILSHDFQSDCAWAAWRPTRSYWLTRGLLPVADCLTAHRMVLQVPAVTLSLLLLEMGTVLMACPHPDPQRGFLRPAAALQI